jgi:hypothetical protein
VAKITDGRDGREHNRSTDDHATIEQRPGREIVMTSPPVDLQGTIPETPAIAILEDWTPSGHDLWKFQTSDGYLGNAYWRVAGAAIVVTRPDGTELFRKTWSSREIFPNAWPGMFEWLKGHVLARILADRAKRETGDPSPTTASG